MARIVRLVALVVIAFFAWDYGWPWLQGVISQQDKLSASTGGSSSDLPAGDDAARCLSLANQANDAFGSGIGQFVGDSRDTGAWMRFAGRVQQQVASAQSECSSCIGDACSLAADAMAELDSLILETDGMVRGSTERFSNPATRQEAVYDLLARAREAAGS